MGVIDIEGKEYLSDNKFFADAFNFLLYGGEQVIQSANLRELDTAQIAVPYGNNAELPVQKFRDLLKVWEAKADDNAIYVMLGCELQEKVHYGMPVKNGLYDMIGYSKQIEESKRSYSQKNERQQNKDADLSVENGALRIKLTSEEFLSGLRKGDKLIPIVTAVVYLGDKPWDGALSLHDMLDIKDERLRKFIPDYRINLISPVNMEDQDFDKFNTDLGLAMKVIKHQKEDADTVIKSTEHKKIDPATAHFLNRAVSLGLDVVEEEGGVDMCLAMEKKALKDKILGAILVLKNLGGLSEETIIDQIMVNFNVSREFVLELMNLKTA